ncbi:hypothetical protein EU527_11040 [Candidatus Thorarchaeota archaeon]|nr:MAG: hypothetical protein EU527_11040 [Candidatus Thorarchaeota archaeon]
MLEDVVVWLQAMYHSGEFSSYISARVPDNKLSTGWIEQSLLQKGFTGKLQDKTNQEQLVIPLDRFVRLTRESVDVTQPILSMFITGKRGLTRPRFVALVSHDSKKQKNSSIAIALQSETVELRETINQLMQFASRTHTKHEIIEPNLDYIEQLKSDVSNGAVTQLLSIRLTASNDKTIELIQNTLKDDSDAKGIVAQYGKISVISPLAILSSRWLIRLDLFRKFKDSVAAIIFMTPSEIRLCLWDSSQRLATFAFIDSLDILDVFEKYVMPLWLTSDDLTKSRSKGPMVVIDTEKIRKPTLPRSIPDKKLPGVVSYHLSDDSIKQLIERVGLLEAQLRDYSRIPSEETPSNDKSLEIIQSRLIDTIDKIESLVLKLNVLEKRIEKVTK